jgi:hypothetical protein
MIHLGQKVETWENPVRDLCRSDKENESIVGGLAIVITREQDMIT